MSERPAGTRKQVHEITIDAPVEAVWKAITDAEELTRWFADAAKVEPGAGGTTAISWDGGDYAIQRIVDWQPNARLVTESVPSETSPLKTDGTQPMMVEYTLERREGKTVLRMVHSGIPNSPDWDGFYDGTNVGWPSFFRVMRHYLEHRAGKARVSVKLIGKLPSTLEDAWTRLTGPAGFDVEPVAGRRFTVRLADETLHGQVIFANAPTGLEVTIDELDAILAHSMAAAGPANFVYSALSVYGKSGAEVAAIRAKWVPWLAGVLGVALATPDSATPPTT
jgi:uncharacterized protein YndB with AHSA1/START domain